MSIKNFVKEITSPRLNIRMFNISDAEELQQMLANNKDYMLPWIPWAVDEPESVEAKKEKIRLWTGEFYLNQKYSYGIFEKNKDQLIGIIFLFTRQGKGILEIGYLIDQAVAGNGYATEATYALMKLCFEHIGIDKVVIHCNKLNVASMKVPQKLDFRKESTQRLVDKNKKGERIIHVIWSMFIEEFKTISTYEPVIFQLEEGFK